VRFTLSTVSVVSLLSTLTAGLLVYAQQDTGNPFLDHSDTGETVHVLPGPASIRSPRDTQPTFAPRSGATFPASYGSGDLIDHGGNVMNPPGFYAVYWNSAVASSTATSQGQATIQTQIAAFVGTFLNESADYNIVSQYAVRGRNPTPGQGFKGDKVDNQPTKASIKDSAIRSYLAQLFGSGVAADPNVIYGVYFPPGMKVMLQGGSSCTSFCGYHSHFAYNGIQIKYAVFPYTDCSGCKLNQMTVADMLTIVTSHEIREAATDPGEFNANAWYDRVGYEADDKCAWHNLYQLNRNSGLAFFVQPEYSNAAHGCVVP
jgi:hypothetical protein